MSVFQSNVVVRVWAHKEAGPRYPPLGCKGQPSASRIEGRALTRGAIKIVACGTSLLDVTVVTLRVITSVWRGPVGVSCAGV